MAQNGLIELVDEKSNDSGFFCSALMAYIMHEAQQDIAISLDDLWLQRFDEAKIGLCRYRANCPIYARTKSNPKYNNIQLQFEF